MLVSALNLESFIYTLAVVLHRLLLWVADVLAFQAAKVPVKANILTKQRAPFPTSIGAALIKTHNRAQGASILT
eukprot:1010434-Pelagomonas_calceolata.AAC.2